MSGICKQSGPYRSFACMIVAISAAVAVGGCASGGPVATEASLVKPAPMFPEAEWGVKTSVRVASEDERVPKGGGQFKIGSPYKVGDKWYNPRHQPDYDRIGIASWYGSDFHGRRTANGEVYDMNALTAAHPTLPMPCYAYVTNLSNGRTVMVRVNDRGPYVGGRMIDLSRGAAQALALTKGGTGRVRVRYAGAAPLDGNDSRERQFLASQPWNGGPTRYAEATPTPYFAPPMPRNYEPEPPPQSFPSQTAQAAWPAPRVDRAADTPWAQTYASNAGPAADTGWTAASYRAGLTGR